MIERERLCVRARAIVGGREGGREKGRQLDVHCESSRSRAWGSSLIAIFAPFVCYLSELLCASRVRRLIVSDFAFLLYVSRGPTHSYFAKSVWHETAARGDFGTRCG